MGQLEREEEYLSRALAEGRISNAEYWRELRELHRDYNAAAHEAAQEAYDRELGNW